MDWNNNIPSVSETETALPPAFTNDPSTLDEWLNEVLGEDLSFSEETSSGDTVWQPLTDETTTTDVLTNSNDTTPLQPHVAAEHPTQWNHSVSANHHQNNEQTSLLKHALRNRSTVQQSVSPSGPWSMSYGSPHSQLPSPPDLPTPPLQSQKPSVYAPAPAGNVSNFANTNSSSSSHSSDANATSSNNVFPSMNNMTYGAPTPALRDHNAMVMDNLALASGSARRGSFLPPLPVNSAAAQVPLPAATKPGHNAGIPVSQWTLPTSLPLSGGGGGVRIWTPHPLPPTPIPTPPVGPTAAALRPHPPVSAPSGARSASAFSATPSSARPSPYPAVAPSVVTGQNVLSSCGPGQSWATAPSPGTVPIEWVSNYSSTPSFNLTKKAAIPGVSLANVGVTWRPPTPVLTPPVTSTETTPGSAIPAPVTRTPALPGSAINGSPTPLTPKATPTAPPQATTAETPSPQGLALPSGSTAPGGVQPKDSEPQPPQKRVRKTSILVGAQEVPVFDDAAPSTLDIDELERTLLNELEDVEDESTAASSDDAAPSILDIDELERALIDELEDGENESTAANSTIHPVQAASGSKGNREDKKPRVQNPKGRKHAEGETTNPSKKRKRSSSVIEKAPAPTTVEVDSTSFRAAAMAWKTQPGRTMISILINSVLRSTSTQNPSAPRRPSARCKWHKDCKVLLAPDDTRAHLGTDHNAKNERRCVIRHVQSHVNKEMEG